MNARDSAIQYARNVWDIIPLHSPTGAVCTCGEGNCGKPGKHPRIGSWQTAYCDSVAVATWWKQWPEANIGLRLDGLLVLDVDGAEGLDSLASLEGEYGALTAYMRQRSGGGGWHYIFEAVPGIEKRIKFRPGLDLLTGPGSYIVCAPSLHASGNQYEWADPINPLSERRDRISLTVPPSWLLRAASKPPATRATHPPTERTPIERIMATALERIQAGSGRNDAGLWLFCQLRDNAYSRDEAVLMLHDWVAKANESTSGQDRYSMREAEATLRSAYRRDARKPWTEPENESHADILLKLIDDFEYFKSGPANDAYVRMVVGDHREVWKVDDKSPKVREVLTHRFLMQKDRAPSRESLSVVIDTIRAKCGAGPKVDVHVRFARNRDVIYLDLSDEQWRAIEVTREGWRVVENPPVLFRRGAGARPLPVPVKNGTLESLRPLLNCGDDAQWCLVVAWLVGAFLPQGAFCHLVLNGEQGCAKSTTSLVLISMLDPSDAGLSGPPKDEVDATVSALHAGILAYDNLGTCKADLSDVFCRFSTGQGYRTRTFYENLGVTVTSVRLPILLNGIDSTVMRGDLLERCIMLKLPVVTPKTRLTVQSIWTDFAVLHPTCLGALLDAVSTGLRNLPNTDLTDAPRMSDFATWVVACEPALPWKRGEFIAAYRRKVEEANTNLAENDSVASALLEWIESTIKEGEGKETTAKDLLVSLNRITQDCPKDLRYWPLSPEGLSHRLVRLAPVLRAQGVEVRRLSRTKKARSRWQVWRNGPQGSLVPVFIAEDEKAAA